MFTTVFEGSVQTSKVNVQMFKMRKAHKFGFMVYERNSECASIMEFDSLRALASCYGFDVDCYYPNLEAVKVGETFDTGCELFVRIF